MNSTSTMFDPAALAAIREVLDDTMYALVDFRLTLEAPISPTGFPRAEQLGAVVARLDPSTRAIFALLRLGQSVDAQDLEASALGGTIDALASSGLIERRGDSWRTADLMLVPIEGLYLLVSTPPSYPTATRPADVWFDLSSYVLAKALPSTLAGESVLDLCCGSGVQGILCATRGARSVLGLDISEGAVRLAQINAGLNRVADRTEFRVSDGIEALAQDERFDLVICNTPYAPVTGGALTIERIGNRVLIDMIDAIPGAMTPQGRAILAAWRSPGLRGRTAQHDYLAARLAPAGFGTRAFVERAPDTREGVLKIFAADAEATLGAEPARILAARAAELLANAPIDGFYNQLIRSERRVPEAQTFGLDLAPVGDSR